LQGSREKIDAFAACESGSNFTKASRVRHTPILASLPEPEALTSFSYLRGIRMKHYLKPVAAVVTLALAAASAHAATYPAYSTSAPGTTGEEVYLAVFDSNATGAGDAHAGYTDLINLTSLYTDLALSGGSSILTTPSGSAPWQSGVANPTGAAGTVYQINLGTISNWSSIFTAGQTNTSYMIVSQNGSAVLSTDVLGTKYTGSAVSTQASNIKNELANWGGASGATSPFLSTSMNDTYSALGGPLNYGYENGSGGPTTGEDFAGAVGTALGFYNTTPAVRGGAPLANTPFSYNGNQGFWFLSSTGDLTWNLIESSGTTVPLPAAFWLLASGLAGLGAIGRRRLGVA
jgi:hypothetical protein